MVVLLRVRKVLLWNLIVWSQHSECSIKFQSHNLSKSLILTKIVTKKLFLHKILTFKKPKSIKNKGCLKNLIL